MSPGKNKILMLTTDPGFGGAERSFAALSVALSKKHDVYCVFFNADQKANYDLGGNIINLNIPPAKSWYQSVTNFVRRIYQIRQIKREHKIDISISFLEGANYINILSRIKDKIIISVRGSKIHDINIQGIGKILRLKILIPMLYPLADKIVCISDGLRKELINHFKIKRSRIIVIYNFIQLDKIEGLSHENLPTNLSKFFTDPVIINHSRLAKEKGIDFLIEVFNEVIKAIPTVKLLIIGDGPQKSDLTKLCQRLALNYIIFNLESTSEELSRAQVVFAGYQPNPFKFLKHSTLFVSTSKSEGFGNSILEAMASHTPAISLDCPYGPSEIISDNHRNGILIQMNNKSAVDYQSFISGKIIVNLLNNTQLLNDLSINGYNRAGFFNKNKYQEMWNSVIENI